MDKDEDFAISRTNEAQLPIKEEMEEIIARMRNIISSGHNGIAAEIIKHGGELLQELHDPIREIWTTEGVPETWKSAKILPIYKKSNQADCSNYRGIALQEIRYKI